MYIVFLVVFFLVFFFQEYINSREPISAVIFTRQQRFPVVIYLQNGLVFTCSARPSGEPAAINPTPSYIINYTIGDGILIFYTVRNCRIDTRARNNSCSIDK